MAGSRVRRKTAPPDAWIFQHLHGENAEAILLELFDDVADRAFGNGVRFHEGKSALQRFHSW